MSVTTVAVMTNDFKVKNPKLVKQVLEQLGFNVSIYKDDSINATSEEDNIDDTTYVVVNSKENVTVYSELLCNLEDMDKNKAIPFTEFIQDQLLEKEHITIYVVGTESRISGLVGLGGYATCITKKAQKHISLHEEVSKFLAEKE